ncbi:MAG: tetratricopeptide (TPR) repeat protein [Mariniblastus sp.]|jgi:tetratricopeptide (TPR) repeat protein
MSLNINHYAAIGLGLSVCTAFFFHRPAATDQAMEFEPFSSSLSPLAEIQGLLPARMSPIQSATHIAQAQTLQTPGLPVRALQDFTDLTEDGKADQATIDGKLERALTLDSAASTPLELPSLTVSNERVEDQLDEFDFHDQLFQINDSETIAIETIQANAVVEPESTAPQAPPAQMALVQSQPSTTRNSDSPNSQWQANQYIDSSRQLDRPMTARATARATAPEFDSLNLAAASHNQATDSMEISAPSNGVVSKSETPFYDSIGIAGPETPAESILGRGDSTQGTKDFIPTASADASKLALVSPNRDEGIAPASLPPAENVAQQAVHHIEYGKSLARRGATHAASEEFMAALKVIARSNDEMTGGNHFSRSMSQAILAMEEAADFASPNVASQILVEIGSIIESHRSNLITVAEAQFMNPAQAMDKYYSFAQQKLDESGGRNVVTAEAFYCLGKLHTATATQHAVPQNSDIAKAATFHRAALLSDSNHHRSANELGVLLARSGRFDQATALFKQSLRANPAPQTWRNLAQAHQRLGELDLAKMAEVEFRSSSQSRVANSESGIQWMRTQQFNSLTPLERSEDTRIASKLSEPRASSYKTKQNKSQNEKSFTEKLKDLF